MSIKTITNAPGITAVFGVIVDERQFQDKRWGTIQEHPHEVGSWILLMESLLVDARDAWCGNRGDAGALDEIRKVVAVGVACQEQHGVVHRADWREKDYVKAYGVRHD